MWYSTFIFGTGIADCIERCIETTRNKRSLIDPMQPPPKRYSNKYGMSFFNLDEDNLCYANLRIASGHMVGYVDGTVFSVILSVEGRVCS